VPAERAGAALRGLELTDERRLGGDPRLVELVGRQLVGEREAVIDQGADRGDRVPGTRGRGQHEQARIAEGVDVRVRAGRELIAIAEQARQPRGLALAEEDRGDIERREIGDARTGRGSRSRGTPR